MQGEERITNPLMGSNNLGREIQEDLPGVYAGSDTQLQITALGGKKHKHKNGVNANTETKQRKFRKS
ncbi:MAG: hypothetical protein KGM16_16005 [Bacteroidota bacterium]|nr:hypothetical protein [Bacteroidota bacterium]